MQKSREADPAPPYCHLQVSAMSLLWDPGTVQPHETKSVLLDQPAGVIHSGTATQQRKLLSAKEDGGGQDHHSQQLTAGQA